MYITDLYLPCADTETGDFRMFPFPGSAAEQPYMTMQVLKLIQLQYRMHLEEKMKKIRAGR